MPTPTRAAEYSNAEVDLLGPGDHRQQHLVGAKTRGRINLGAGRLAEAVGPADHARRCATPDANQIVQGVRSDLGVRAGLTLVFPGCFPVDDNRRCAAGNHRVDGRGVSREEEKVEWRTRGRRDLAGRLRRH